MLPDGPRRPGPSPATVRPTQASRRPSAASGAPPKLSELTIDAVTEGQDALGEVSTVVETGGLTSAGSGVSADIIDASYTCAAGGSGTLAGGRLPQPREESVS
jgi:hypothetical protein